MRLTTFAAFLCCSAALGQQYKAAQNGDTVHLEDTKSQTVVSIVTSVGNEAYELKVKGQNVLRFPYASLEDFKARPSLSGIPFLSPWANRLDEQAFYANGKKYNFNMDLGNVRGAIPMHGFLTTNNEWKVVEVKADRDAAWVTSRLDFYRQSTWMAQFPFAHVITMTHKLHDGVLQVDQNREHRLRRDAHIDRLPSLLHPERFAARRMDRQRRSEDELASESFKDSLRAAAHREVFRKSAVDRAQRLQPR